MPGAAGRARALAGHPPRTLQSYITRLRKGLGAEAIARTGTAYRFDLPADAVDAIRFQDRIGRGDIDAALAEWTGHPLAGVEAPGLAAVVDGLVEQWLTAVEADLAARVETDAASAVGPLTELTARYPVPGRVAGAADDGPEPARPAGRRDLVDRLGIEPGIRLRELESLILSQDRSLVPRASRGGNLPTGRDA